MNQKIHSKLRQVLLQHARAGTILNYRDLAALAEVPPPHSIHEVTLALEDLIRDDHAAGRPLLAALAISRGNGTMPGHGFFHLLTELGRYEGPDGGPQAQAAYDRELQEALRYWGSSEPIVNDRGDAVQN